MNYNKIEVKKNKQIKALMFRDNTQLVVGAFGLKEIKYEAEYFECVYSDGCNTSFHKENVIRVLYFDNAGEGCGFASTSSSFSPFIEFDSFDVSRKRIKSMSIGPEKITLIFSCGTPEFKSMDLNECKKIHLKFRDDYEKIG